MGKREGKEERPHQEARRIGSGILAAYGHWKEDDFLGQGNHREKGLDF
jgi:hypothetical protein